MTDDEWRIIIKAAETSAITDDDGTNRNLIRPTCLLLRIRPYNAV